MCDPITAIIGALTAGSSLLSATKKAPKPPPLPALAPPPATPTNADVRAQEDAKTDTTAPDYTGFKETRKFGSNISGLGKGGLAL